MRYGGLSQYDIGFARGPHEAQRSHHPSAAALPAQAIAEDVLREKYAKGNEKTIADVRQRIARALAAVEAPAQRDAWEQAFFEAQESGLHSGRAHLLGCGDRSQGHADQLLRAAGRRLHLGDEKTPVGIYDALQEAAETMRRGGGVGYDFSPHPPAGAWVKGTQSSAPAGRCRTCACSTESCKTVESAGSRRGAQMGILRCDHPGRRAFVHAKDDGDFRTSISRWRAPTPSWRPCAPTASGSLCTRRRRRASSGPAARTSARDGMWVYRTVRARDLWTRSWRRRTTTPSRA